MKPEEEKTTTITFTIPRKQAEKLRRDYARTVGETGGPLTFSAYIRKRFEKLDRLEALAGKGE